MVSLALKCVFQTLKRKDGQLLRNLGVKRPFIIQSFEEVASLLAAWHRTGFDRDLRSYDVETMYTSIPHEDLVQRLTDVVDEALLFESSQLGVDTSKLVLSGNSNGVSWRESRPASDTGLNALKDWTLTVSTKRFNCFSCGEYLFMERESTSSPKNRHSNGNQFCSLCGEPLFVFVRVSLY